MAKILTLNLYEKVICWNTDTNEEELVSRKINDIVKCNSKYYKIIGIGTPFFMIPGGTGVKQYLVEELSDEQLQVLLQPKVSNPTS